MLKGFVAGLAVANAYEWFAHKYLLHGVHRKGKPRFIGHIIVKSVNKTFLMIVMWKV